MISFGSLPGIESSAIKTLVFGDLSAQPGRWSKTALMVCVRFLDIRGSSA
jgi:hypothetical protein